jgi:uncharacterized repeat protein (TIGR01451 family)
MKNVLLVKNRVAFLFVFFSFLAIMPASSQFSTAYIRAHWSCGSGAYNSMVYFDTLMYASTPDHLYYLIDPNYNITSDSLPNVGTYTPSIMKFHVGRDLSLYALTDTVVMKLTSSGWLNTGFSTGSGIRDIAVDQNGVIWTITNIPLVPGTSEIKRFDGVLTHTIPSFQLSYWEDQVFKADDSGAVWVGNFNGLLRYDTSSFTHYYSNQVAYELQLDSIGNLYFILDSVLMKHDSNGFTALQNLPLYGWHEMTSTIYNGNFYLFYKSSWYDGALVEVTPTAINQISLGGMTFCSDSTYACLTFDNSAKLWVLGKNFSETGGNIYVHDTLLTASISGKIFHDVNQNGIYDGGDLPLPGVEIFNNFTYLTDTSDVNGDYTFSMPPVFGAQWVSSQIPIYLPAPWTFTTPGQQFYSSIDSLNVTGINHGLYAPPATPNLRVYAFGAICPPGFNSHLNCFVQNVSTTTLYNIDTWFVNSSVFDTCISQVAPATISQNIYYWLIDSLLPLGSKVITLTLPMDSTTPLGSPYKLAFYVNHPMDLYHTDDSIFVQGFVSGSFDPNDKLVVPDRPEKTIAPEELLTYTIRFQNTGTAPATKVVLRDTLSQHLDLSTLRFIGSSHPYTYAFYSGNEMVITYDNINLPDSGANYAGSMGAITFSIKPLSGLSGGTKIHNEAYIYFDFNQPIKTNQTESIISIISVEDSRPFVKPEIVVWPNPTRGLVNVSHQDMKSNVPCSLTLFDVSGRRVVSIHRPGVMNSIELDLTGLENGIYIGIVEMNRTKYHFRVVKSNSF